MRIDSHIPVISLWPDKKDADNGGGETPISPGNQQAFQPTTQRSPNVDSALRNKRVADAAPAAPTHSLRRRSVDAPPSTLNTANTRPAGFDQQVQEYGTLLSNVVSALPQVTGMARDEAKALLKKRTGESLDPDKTWLHFFGSNADTMTPGGVSGWAHNGPPQASKTLTQAVEDNFDASWQDQTPDDVNLEAGIYRDGPQAKRFDGKNEVNYKASDLRNDIWGADFQTKVQDAQEQFWSGHKADWKTLARAEFAGQARAARMNGELSPGDYELVMKGGAPGVDANGPATLAQLRADAAPDKSVHVRPFDINGYASSDIRRFIGQDGREVVYLPGEQKPFHAFENEQAFKNWIIEQARDPQARDALARHFSLYNRQDGSSYTGVDSGLEKLASGRWDGSAIDSASDTNITGDVFNDLAEATRKRGASDADTVITSNGEVRTQMWKNYLNAANSVFGPVAGAIGGPIAGVAGAAFAAQLGVEGYQAATGDTLQQRQQAASELTGDVATVLLFSGLVKGAGKDINADAAHSQKPWFRPPQTLENGQTGYPLGPTRPPKLPASDKNPTQSSSDNATPESTPETGEGQSTRKRPADTAPEEAPSTKRPADSTIDQPVTSGTDPTFQEWQLDDLLSATPLNQPWQWDSSDLLSMLRELETPGSAEGKKISTGSPQPGPSHPAQNSPESSADTYLDLDGGALYFKEGDGKQAGQTGVNPSASTTTAGAPSHNKPDTHAAPERAQQAGTVESNPTWTAGDVQDLKIDKRCGNADCGQFAAGNATGGYRVGSIDTVGTDHQVPDFRSPMSFNPAHGLSANDLINSPVPIMAEGVAYVDLNTGAFHYGKLVGQAIMQTDANQYSRYGVGGTLSHYKMNNGKLEFIGQRGIQPVLRLSSVKDFVQYCQTHYDMSNAVFFFCHFHKGA